MWRTWGAIFDTFLTPSKTELPQCWRWVNNALHHGQTSSYLYLRVYLLGKSLKVTAIKIIKPGCETLNAHFGGKRKSRNVLGNEIAKNASARYYVNPRMKKSRPIGGRKKKVSIFNAQSNGAKRKVTVSRAMKIKGQIGRGKSRKGASQG